MRSPLSCLSSYSTPLWAHMNGHQLLAVVSGNGWPQLCNLRELCNRCLFWVYGLELVELEGGRESSKKITSRGRFQTSPSMFMILFTAILPHSSNQTLQSRFPTGRCPEITCTGWIEGGVRWEKTTGTTAPTHVMLSVYGGN